MTTPTVRLQFESPSAHFQPGERLTGRYQVENLPSRSARAVELSILWNTAGKGEEDIAVHHFERHVDESTRPLDLRVPHRFATLLPPSPLSYDGVIVKVCWCVRIRVFLSQGQETVTEMPFSFGNVPAGQIEQPIAE